jgi:hypothetical protein
MQAQMYLTFDAEGFLSLAEIMNPITVTPLLNLPSTEEAFLHICKKHKLKYTIMPTDLSFNNFWNTYAYKEGGSKMKAEASWNKLSDQDKLAALNFIKQYNTILIKQNVAKAHATTYLNQRRWDNT